MSARSTRISRTPRLALLIALTAALTLLGVSVRSARAASTLTASENPVIIAAPSMTKTISLAWTLDLPPSPLATTITVTEVSGPVVLSQALTAQSGSLLLTVTCGKTYLAELKATSINLLFDAETIVAQRPGRPPAPCVTEPGPEPGPLKILKTNVTAHGTYAAVKAEATKPASWIAEIGKKPPNSSGYFAAGDVVSASWPVCCFTDWTAGKVFNLQPDTEYHWVIRAATAAGEQAFKTGTVRTEKRRVEVTFTKIDMIDDSDALSDCDCIFWFQAGSAPIQQVGDSSQGIATGITLLLQPNVTFTINEAPDSLVLRVEGFDEDCISLLCLPFCVFTQPSFGSGSAYDCGEWNSKSHTVLTVPDGAGNEAYTKPFQFQTTGSHPLQFRAHGNFKVSYY